MKNFERQNRLLSLCGLNCGLCRMYIGHLCPGCGGGEGNQSCKIARCSLGHGSVEYCFQCAEYPCEKYEHVDDFDSFITHRRRRADIEKARRIGIDAYNGEQIEKAELLKELLERFNDGRKKTFFCLAVNLLEVEDIKAAITHASEIYPREEMSKERSSYVTSLLEKIAAEKGISLKMRRKR